MTGGDSARLRLIVSGRVQGVFFRAAARERARTLNLRGYAKNLSDGTVEIVVEGRREDLRAMAEWARIGPPAARVDDVRVEWSESLQEFEDFTVA
ncbi:acylphosphatase [bacterium]|nr:acylphosphatase [bacterium]